MDLADILVDLKSKLPWLQGVLRPEYTSYFNTACTVLLGWLIVCWLSHAIWVLLAPLTVSAIAVAFICPTTLKWCVKHFMPNIEIAFKDLMDNLQHSVTGVT